MKILPISIHQKQVSHKAVDQKILKEARDMYNRAHPHHNLLPIIGDVVVCAMYRILSDQDAIDTLNAIKPYAQNQSVVEDIEDRIKSIKKTMSSR